MGESENQKRKSTLPATCFWTRWRGLNCLACLHQPAGEESLRVVRGCANKATRQQGYHNLTKTSHHPHLRLKSTSDNRATHKDEYYDLRNSVRQSKPRFAPMKPTITTRFGIAPDCLQVSTQVVKHGIPLRFLLT